MSINSASNITQKRWLWIILFLLVDFLACSANGDVKAEDHRESCSVQDHECHDDLSNVDKIMSWWDSMSSLKPLKCKDRFAGEPISDEDLDTVTMEFRILESCGKNDVQQLYAFKGFEEIREEGEEGGGLSGSGKMILKPSGDMAREIEQQDLSPSSGKKYSFKWLCFAPRELGFGKDVAELTGSLLNNTVHGVAKFKYTDNSTSIGRYHKGVLHGVRRMFSAENNSLQSVYNFRNGVKVGRGWRLENGHALLHVNYGQQPHHLDEEDEEMLAIINGTEVFSGRFQEFLLELQDLRRANIELLDLPSPNGDCIMDDIKWTSADKSERLPFIYSTEWKLEVPDGYREQDFCKSDFKTPQLRLWEHLQQHHRSWSKSRPFFFGDQYPLHFMKSETMPVEPVEGKSVRVISNVTLVNMKRRRFTASLWGRPAQDIVIANARFNRNKQLQGTLNVYVVDFTSPETEGVEVPWLKGKRMTGFQGRFSDGVLKGIVKLYFSFSQLIFAEVEDGYLHGGMVSYGQSPVLPGNKLRDILTPGIRFLGHYRSGRAHGHFWHGCLGGGFYHGLIGDDGTVTGDEIAFIYPDMETAFLGKFENFVMKSAQEVEVLETRCDDYGMITVSKYTDPSGPVFYYEAPTNVSFGAGPPGVRDPFERKWVELSKSQIPGSGEGVILKQKPLGSMYVSLYCGYMYNLEQKIIYSQKCLHNTSLTDDHRRHCKKYSIGISFNNKQINIPPEIDMEGVFQPTLGQKLNHHFTKNNTVFSDAEHPRWGLIQSVVVSEEMAAKLEPGDELFAYYGYKSDSPFPEDFPWYFELKAKSDKEEREKEEAKKEKPRKRGKKTTNKKEPVS